MKYWWSLFKINLKIGIVLILYENRFHMIQNISNVSSSEMIIIYNNEWNKKKKKLNFIKFLF